MPSDLRKELIGKAAERARRDAFFIAFALEAYRSLHNLDDDGLASFLGGFKANLPRLALCRRPDSLAPTFQRDVERIAAYAEVIPLQLARLLREIDTIVTLRGSGSTADVETPGLLAAAREAEGEPEDRSSDPDADVQDEKHEE